MSRERILNFGWSALLAMLFAGGVSCLVGFLIVSLAADDALESAINDLEAIATDRGGVVRSIHRNDSLSYSITAIVREDQLGRPRTLLSDQPDGVTREYVHAHSGEHDVDLRVGIDRDVARAVLFVSPEVILTMSMWFLGIFPPVFVFFGSFVFEPALL